MGRSLRGLVAAAALGGLMAACATVSGPPPASPGPVETRTEWPLAVHWQRTAAEHRAVYAQIFELAGKRLEDLVVEKEPGTWAIVSDADETILDNSTYAVELVEAGAEFSAESWTAWVARREAPPLPGARAFLDRVHELGGRIAIVTNRMEHECDDTRANFAQESLRFDVILCRPPHASSDKDPRFRAVEEGTTSAGLPPLEIVLYLGDNIGDFPGVDQEIRHRGAPALEPFGDRWFVFPNPVYGSWQSNPQS